ncbi:hypothetical protein ACFQE8_19980 [Salinirubellus sp. GCM10025818]|uniref:hypothetical protein n=1 Tax=Salinirubellus TaxID=2162630 RepID=UPI0030CA7822
MNAGRRRLLGVAAGAVSLGLSGCSESGGLSTDGRGTRTTPSPPASRPGTPSPANDYRYTSLTPGGNRVVDGSVDLESVEPVDVPLDGDPRWILARPEPDGSGGEWVVVTGTSVVSAVRSRRKETREIDVEPATVDPETPPVLGTAGRPVLLATPEEASTLTHPLPLGSDGLLYVRPDGTVVRERSGSRSILDVDALPDARPRIVDDDRVALLAGATDRYDHGALGDGIEGGRLVVLDTTGPELRVTGGVEFRGTVAEGLAPLVAGEGATIHVTESDAGSGARQVAYAPTGTRLAAGPSVGQGFRWRHQLCLAPFAPDGIPELAVVRTPHIGGTVEFYRREGSELMIEATESGVSSHALGSRVLDGGFAADVDADGRPELVVPDDARTSLVVVSRTEDGATTTARVPVGGRVTSNLHAVHTAEGLQVGVGRPGALRVWA